MYCGQNPDQDKIKLSQIFKLQPRVELVNSIQLILLLLLDHNSRSKAVLSSQAQWQRTHNRAFTFSPAGLNISLCGTKEAVPNLLTTGFEHENFVVQKGTIPNLLTSWFAHATFVVPKGGPFH
jgi:hypothetical protein